MAATPCSERRDWWEDKTAQKRGSVSTFGQLALEKVGVPVPQNSAVRLNKAGRPFWATGLGDQIALLPRRKYGRTSWQGVDDLPATLENANDGAPILLLAQEPDVFLRVLNSEIPVAVTLSGHTHGGQFRVFGHSPVVPSRYGKRYAYGHVTEPRDDGGLADLVVSGGLGCSIAPVRFGVPPEIVLLELSSPGWRSRTRGRSVGGGREARARCARAA